MSSLPIGRVSQLTQSSSLLSSLLADQTQLMTIQKQISTGQALNLPSDNPTSAVGIMRLNQQLSTNDQYSKNLSFANSTLSTADHTLTQLSQLISQAQSIASRSIGPSADPSQRASQAQLVASIISQIQDMANTQYQNQSVFGGQNTSANPFSPVAGGIQYVGTSQGQSLITPSGTALPYTLDGSTAFGGLSASIGGGQALSPALNGTTRLADLAGATQKGIALGPINITVGATTVSADLSSAATVNDVVNIVNAALTTAGSDAILSISGGSFVLTGDSTNSITIANAGSTPTAADLGLATTVASAAIFSSANLGAAVTATTPLSALNNGAGLDPSGFIITNGSNSATISLAGLTNVRDLLNAINTSGTNVTAKISPGNTGIQIQNALSGSPLTIGENGGTTATQLGIRSLNTTTSLTDLNQGTGITYASATQSGPTGNIIVTQVDGTQFSVPMNGITTTSQLIAAINSATGNANVTAALNPTGNGITLTDSSVGPGNLALTAGSNYLPNNIQLVIPQTGSGGTLVGANLTFATDDFRITRKDGTTFTVNLTGTQTIQDVLNKINSADGNAGANKVTASLNPNGNGIQLSDASVGAGSLFVSDVNGSTAADQLGILQTAPAAAPGVINGTDVNPIEPQGLFTSLAMLQKALQNNDVQGITQAGTLLSNDSTRAISANGIIGARLQDIQQRLSNVSDENTQLQSSLDLLSNTDMTTALTQFQTLQTAYQAALQAASTTNHLSLMDFLK